MSRPIYVYGMPGPVGGACTELWHTIKLWRSLGIEVAVVATSEPDPAWTRRVEGIGCCVHRCRLASPWTFPSDGSIVVGFCNAAFRFDAPALRQRGCRLVYVPCMCFPWPDEWKGALFDRYVFQSEYQRSKLLPRLRHLGFNDCLYRLIRGAFDISEFPFKPWPHVRGEPFVVGRLSRAYGQPGNVPALDKFPRDLWEQYARIPHAIKARVMGWSAEIEVRCGTPPAWAEVLPQNAETSQEFLAKIHCLVPGIACCAENWPRVGLEAMAAGVPIVVERKGGWREMSAAALVEDVEQQACAVARLAYDEEFRQEAIGRQGGLLARHINPDRIGQQWLELFEELQASRD